MDNRYKTLFKDAGIFAIGSFGSKVILFLLVPVYTSFMTTDEYGTADLVFTVAQLVLPVVSIVVFDAVLRFGLSKDENPENVLLCGLLVCAIGSVAVLAIVPLIALYDAVADWRWYLCIYVILNMFGAVEMNYLKTKNKNHLYALFAILQTLLLAICNIIFLCVEEMGIAGYLLSTCISSLIPVICPVVFGGGMQSLKAARFDASLMKRMCAYSAPLIVNNLSWWGIHSADKIMVEFFWDAAVLGLFTVATKIPALINVAITIFGQAWGISAVREIETTKDMAFYATVLKVLLFAAFGIAAVLIAIVKPFMAIYVGEAFEASWQYVPLLLLSASFSAIASYCGSVYSALYKSVNGMISTLVSALVCVATGWILIPIWGIWGAVVSLVSSYVCLALYRLIDINRYVRIGYGGRHLIVNAILVLVEAICVSFEWFALPVSLCTLALFLLNNLDLLKRLVRRDKA